MLEHKQVSSKKKKTRKKLFKNTILSLNKNVSCCIIVTTENQ